MSQSTGPREDDPQDGQEPPRRQPIFNMPGVVTALIGVCAGIHLLRVYLLSPAADFAVLIHFAFVPLRYTGGYPLDVFGLVSPLSYAFLHGGAAHLIVNMVWLAAFGSPLANRIGTLRFLALWAAASLAAVAFHFALHPFDAAPLIGASGAVSGMTGAAARFAFRTTRSRGKAAFAGPVLPLSLVFRSRTAVAFLAVWMIVNLAVGLGFGADPGAPRIAWEAHVGGFLVGFLAVRAFDRRPSGEDWRV